MKSSKFGACFTLSRENRLASVAIIGDSIMSKFIRLSDNFYYWLSQERKGGESFDEALKRLLRWDEK